MAGPNQGGTEHIFLHLPAPEEGWYEEDERKKIVKQVRSK
jgi:hypothetical protein